MAMSASARTCDGEIGIHDAADAAGVHHAERLLPEFAVAKEPVARHAGLIVDDRNPAAGQPVEKRGFADVRPADDGNGVHHLLRVPVARGAKLAS